MGRTDYSFSKKAGLAAFAMVATIVSGMATQLDVTTTAPGTLATLISEDDKWNITELKVSGPLNGFDIRTLRDMAGADLYGAPTEGKLEKLDMAGVNIIGYDESLSASDQTYYIDNSQGIMHLIGENDKFLGIFFAGCNVLKELTIPDNAFLGVNQGWPEGLEKISVSNNNPNLTVVDNILYSKDLKTLFYCPAKSPQTSIRTPEATEIVESYAFYQNLHLQSVEMSNIKEIKSFAFSYCNALQTLSFGNYLATWGDMAIMGNYQLSSVTVAADNPNFKNIGNSLTDISGRTLYIFAADNTVEACDVPEGVETICSGAIYSNHIRTATFPNSVTTLRQYAIFNSLYLETIHMGSGLTNLEPMFSYNLPSLQEYDVDSENPVFASYNGAIYSKDGLTLTIIPEGKTEFNVKEGTEQLGIYCLGAINNIIETLTLPASLKTLVGMTLSCNSLKEIYCKATVPPTSNGYLPFYSFMAANIDLFVPTGCADAYKNSLEWRDFRSISEFDSSDIDGVTASEKPYEVARYSIDGKRLPAETPGLNLIKMSDGSVQKVWVPGNR